MEYIQLSNGVMMPQLGYGTIGQSGEQIISNVAFALNNGYRLIDTANRYGNEVEVGQGLKASGLKREDYFLETKLGPTLYENDQAIDDTLKRLDVDYIDLMILHHPVNHYLYAYGMLEKAYQEGKLKAIGLSNFPVDKIQEILDHCKIPPMVMQVEGHPYYPAEACHEFCDAHDIKLQCWFPLGHGSQELLNDPVVVELAKAHDRTSAQIVLRWHVQMGFTPMPGSRSEGHIAENAKIFEFSLTEEEMQKMAGINRHTPFYKVTPESLARLATTKCNFEE